MGNQSRVGFSTGKKLLVTKRNMRSGSGALSTWGTNLCTVKLFIQLMYNKNDHLAKWSIFCQIFDVFFRLYNPFAPLDPRRPLHMLYTCIATFNCPKGILGLGGAKHLKTK